VIEVGAGVDGLAVGDLVAVAGCHHASVETVRADAVFRVPDGVRLDDAALVQLGVIAAQGVRRAAIAPGEDVVVLGAGIVGLLAGRLARAHGSGQVTFVARSADKAPIATAYAGARFVSLAGDHDAIETLEAPVVIDATGDPDALATAVEIATTGGRIVLLGSPRGVTVDLGVPRLREKRLELVGAHVETLTHERRADGGQRRELAAGFLATLGDGVLEVADLVGPRIDPREADAFYRDLARDGNVVAARFDWTRVAADVRVAPGGLLRVPDVRARGVDPEHPVRVVGGRRVAPPSEDAVGMLRIGFVGCGDIAVHNARAVTAAPNANLVACYDPASSLAAELAAAHGATAEESLDALLDRDDVQAVFIAVPHHLHVEVAARAAAAGKHVIVEKPLAHTLASAVELVDAVERAGVVLSVCFPHRYDARAVAARQMIRDGGIGELGGTMVNFFSEKPPSYWFGGFSGRATSTWRTSVEHAGGGVLIMNLSHVIDLVRHLTSEEVDLCFAATSVTDAPAEVEDTVAVSIRYANGAVGSLTGSSALRGHRGGRTDIHVWGSDGYVVVEPELRVYSSRAIRGLGRTTRWQSLDADAAPPVDIRTAYVTRVATAIELGRPPDVTAADALAVQAIIEAAYRSSESGETVRPGDLLVAARA
jgi:predicted dehydrogenase